MTMDLQALLRELKTRLRELYGERLRGVYLFGSYARGEARPDSDIDVAVVLDDFAHGGEEIARWSEARTELALKYDCVIALLPLREADWAGRQSPLLLNLRREGVPLR